MGIRITDPPELVALQLIQVNGFVPRNFAEAETMVKACIDDMFSPPVNREIVKKLMRERAKIVIAEKQKERAAQRDRDHYLHHPQYGVWG